MDERLTLTVEETAERIGKSKNWVRERIRSGEIPHVRIGGSILVPVEALKQRLNGGAA